MRMQFCTPHPICKHVWTQSYKCHNSRTALNTRCPYMPGSLATKTSSTLNNHAIAETLNLKLRYTFSHGPSKEPFFVCEKKKKRTMIYYIESLKYILQYDWAIFADERNDKETPENGSKQKSNALQAAPCKKRKQEVPDFKTFAQCRSTIVLFRHDACDARWHNDVKNRKQLWMSNSWCEKDMLQPHEQKCINKQFLQLRGGKTTG